MYKEEKCPLFLPIYLPFLLLLISSWRTKLPFDLTSLLLPVEMSLAFLLVQIYYRRNFQTFFLIWKIFYFVFIPQSSCSHWFWWDVSMDFILLLCMRWVIFLWMLLRLFFIFDFQTFNYHVSRCGFLPVCNAWDLLHFLNF